MHPKIIKRFFLKILDVVRQKRLCFLKKSGIKPIPQAKVRYGKEALISLQKVEYSYNSSPSFNFSLDIKESSFNVILGSNGSGKSTLLMLISGILEPRSGDIYINETNCTYLPPSLRNLSFLFQKYNLFPHLTIIENISLALKTNQTLKKKNSFFIETLLKQLKILEIKNCLPEEVSGGQMQRASIARCLAQDKSILLLDEPFSSLEPLIRHQLIKYMHTLHKKKNLTLLITTHDPLEFMPYDPNVIFVDSQKIKFSGTSQNFLNSKDKTIQSYLRPFRKPTKKTV